MTQAQITNYALADIERLLRLSGSSLEHFKPIPFPDQDIVLRKLNHLIQEERNYDRNDLTAKHIVWLAQLTDEQRKIYDAILVAVEKNDGGLYFVHGFGGTGKTFLWKTLAAAIRSKGDIMLNVASSGIAALLLEGGRTAHSRFGIPLNVTEFTTCSISAGSDLAELINESKLIIWDEAPMMSKYCFETVDRSFRDILKNNKPFGGKVVVFGGDFRQILPVVTDGGRVETVLASLNSSFLWRSCKVLSLTKNMRLMSNGLSADDVVNLKNFSEWILDVGDGKINNPNDGEVEIDIPNDLLINNCVEPITTIVDDVYGLEFSLNKDPVFYQGRAILSPRNQDVDIINDYMLSRLTGNF